MFGTSMVNIDQLSTPKKRTNDMSDHWDTLMCEDMTKS
jgi:hypothetical protein